MRWTQQFTDHERCLSAHKHRCRAIALHLDIDGTQPRKLLEIVVKLCVQARIVLAAVPDLPVDARNLLGKLIYLADGALQLLVSLCADLLHVRGCDVVKA